MADKDLKSFWIKVIILKENRQVNSIQTWRGMSETEEMVSK